MEKDGVSLDSYHTLKQLLATINKVYLDSHQAVLLCVLEERFGLQVRCVSGFVLVGFDPADILASPEAPSSQTLPSFIQTLRRTTPDEHKRGVPRNLKRCLYSFFEEMMGQRPAREDSIDTLCLPLGVEAEKY